MNGCRRCFVPKGPNDGSQATYCLECVQKKEPSRRVRCEPDYSTCSPLKVQNLPSDPIIPFPTGRTFFFKIPGTSYLATIIQSLRDSKPLRHLSSKSTPLHRAIRRRERGRKPVVTDGSLATPAYLNLGDPMVVRLQRQKSAHLTNGE